MANIKRQYMDDFGNLRSLEDHLDYLRNSTGEHCPFISAGVIMSRKTFKIGLIISYLSGSTVFEGDINGEDDYEYLGRL